MKFKAETGFNILTVGRWNPAVLSPQWIRSNVTDSEVSYAIPIDDRGAPPRLSFSNIHLFPTRHYLDARLADVQEAAFPSVGETVSRIIELLRHTPISAVGINFRFVETAHPEQLAPNFQFDDAAKIAHDKYPLLTSTISRSFRLENNDKLNLSLIYDGQEMNVEFNFHTDSSDVATVQSKLTADNINARLEEAKRFMQTTYGLILEEQQGD